MATTDKHHLVVLLIGLLWYVCDPLSGADLFGPLHFEGMVRLEGAVVYFPEPLAQESANDGANDEVGHQALVEEIVAKVQDGHE